MMRTPWLRVRLHAAVLFVGAMVMVVSDARLVARPRAAGATISLENAALLEATSRAPFVRAADSFVAMQSTYAARVEPNGALHFSPRETRPERVAKGRRAHAAREGAALVLETVRASRGSRDMMSAPTISLSDEGSVLIARGEVTEVLDAAREGVEQSWQLASRPEGLGDLVVEIASRGELPLRDTALGVHVHDPASGLGVRYGVATFVDAAGKRVDVRPERVDDRIVLRVPAEVIDSAKYPAILDPTITAEVALDAPVEGLGTPDVQESPWVVATPGGGYFAVWMDDRGSRPAIYGSRISATGTILDPSGIFIAPASDQAIPIVGANASGYFVAWTIQYDDQYSTVGIYGVRVGLNGTVVDSTPITISTSALYPQTPSLASDGTSWLVAWAQYSGKNGYDVVGALFGATGQAANPSLTISATPDSELYPNVIWEAANNRYLVAWAIEGGAPINGAHLSPTGTVMDTFAPALASNGSYMLSVSFSGNEYLYTWYEYRSEAAIYAARVTTAGALLDATSFTIGPDANFDYYPEATWDGTSFVVAWYSGGAIKFARVPTAGVISDTGTTIEASGFSPGIASDGNTSLIVMGTFDTGTSDDVKMARVKAGVALDATPVLLSTSSNAETFADAAFDGTNYYVVWLDSRGQNGTVYGARLDATGKPIDAAPLALSTTVNAVGRPRVSFGGGSYFVVWTEEASMGPQVMGARVATAGTVQGALVPVFPANGDSDGDPAIAFDGTNFLVAWERRDSSTDLDGVQAIRVSTSGTVVDTLPFPISSQSPNEQRVEPDIAFDGTNYLVVWTATQSTGSVQVTHIFGARVSPGKNVLDVETPICTAFLLQQSPRVASDGQTGFLVAWQDYRADLNRADVYAARVSTDGVNVDGTDGFKISAGPDDESLPGVVYLGAGNYVVAWRDLRSQTSYDVYGAWVSLSAVVHDPAGLSLSAQPGDEQQPVMAVGHNTALLGYQRLDPGPTFGSWRVRTRTIDPGLGSGAACAQDLDCASRYCTDGVCCGGDCGGCGTCSAQPGTCTPLPAGSAPRCPLYNCDGTSTDCPTSCQSDSDCSSVASCDTSSHTCVQRVICTDDHTLKDLTGTVTDCTPYKCQGSACQTTCGSADDCDAPFLCDPTGRCVPPPSYGDAGGCAVSRDGTTGGDGAPVFLAFLAAIATLGAARKKRNS